MNPTARKNRLLVEELGPELVIYDEDRHQAHRLNRTATLVWQQCDGRTSMGRIQDHVASELHLDDARELVDLALDDLGSAHLLRNDRPHLFDLGLINLDDSAQ